MQDGFQMLSPKVFMRLDGKIAQYLTLQKTQYGGGDFSVDYFVFILIPPREFVGSVLAGRFPQGKSQDGWWKSQSEESARASMGEVCETFKTFGRSLLDSTRSLSGYVSELQRRGSDSGNAHFHADIGCALLCEGRVVEATTSLERAERQYMAFTVAGKPVEWSAKAAAKMRELLNAVHAGTHGKLIDQWYSMSLVNLGIDKKWKSPDPLLKAAARAGQRRR